VQLAPIYVAFSVPEQYLDQIRNGMTDRKMAVTARSAQGSKPLGEGELSFIDNTVDATTGTVRLKATFKNEDHALWPGAFVEVMLHLDVERGATVVPAPAVTVGQRGSQVYVVKPDGTAELRPVQTGRSVAQETVILDGIKEGEKVVVNGQSRLLPGAKVIEKPAADAPEAHSAKPANATPEDAKPKQATSERQGGSA
jgi:multidrug efflux system membrane fusion protein